ncbi:unnamed protein product [Closterium sp. NIES-65]|nr:unnamed protein product [Closterium sp. NIES-65]
MDADPKRWRVAADVVCDVGAFLECLFPLMPHRFLLLAGLANAGKQDPKRWHIAADVVCDVGAFLECLSPLMPHRYLLLAGLANAGKGLSLVIARATRLSLYDAFAKEGNISSLYANGFKCTPLLPSTLPTTGPLTRNRTSDPLAAGLSLVIARATRLPLYDAFAKEGNISDLYAKGEAISVLSSLAGLALGLKLASSVCQTAQAKVTISCRLISPLTSPHGATHLHLQLAAVPVLAAVHLWSVTEEMRAVPINTLNAQRTNVLINHFLSVSRRVLLVTLAEADF